jgi:hypothetical protein
MAQADKKSVEYDTILDGDTIQEEILQRNCEWFCQAKYTPFGSGVLYDLVGSDGLTEVADAIEYMGVPRSANIPMWYLPSPQSSALRASRTLSNNGESPHQRHPLDDI